MYVKYAKVHKLSVFYKHNKDIRSVQRVLLIVF